MNPTDWPTLLLCGFATGGTLAFIWFVVAAVRDITGPDDEERREQ